MMTPEAKVKKKVKEILHEMGAWYCMPMGTGYGRSGVPDFIGCCKGMMFAIETKAGKGTTTALQDRELQRITEAGGYSCVINEENVDKLKEKLVMALRGIHEWKG